MNRIVLAVVAAFAVAASAAYAAPRHGPPVDRGSAADRSTNVAGDHAPGDHGKKPAKDGAGRCPAVSFVLKGTIASVDAAGGSLVLHVERANRHGRPLVGRDVTVLVDESTKIRRRGPAQLADLTAGDRALVQVRGCKAGDVSQAQLQAVRVLAWPAADADEAD